MNELSLTTPALLFPAVSLLLLAYTNRYLGLAAIVRRLYDDHQTRPSSNLLKQIGSLRQRILLIQWMQGAGVLSLFLCVLAMFEIYVGAHQLAEMTFGVSLICMIASLALSLWELKTSSVALNILLSDLERHQD
ncbi:DUF2721 domain-containing protein [Crenobacter sp. SG2303]|uniref:DUF2721 domain-containing protein n=1 Tax=Crenobacter oryzisoli TaxID=3056844 RepID=A0ABT7XNV6_9NEIS|nr:DUF2721 domain-containing protein [Crenobacter sp. SG2303]MDN0075471.1 DUF2721 domain-containing protein [Crenobacter sp. SG2303]